MIWWYYFLALGAANLFLRAGIAAICMFRLNQGRF